MFAAPAQSVLKRLERLEQHLSNENPALLEAVAGFRDLDRVAYRLGYLDTHQTFAAQVAWWPLISILGTFSAGKSTFINQYLGIRLQETGNQAVDDKFTVICHSSDEKVHTLPGLALDADPRFPFFNISEEIDRVANGEGRRIDSYLQLKTCPSPVLRGKTFIDSPGFDADDQRRSTLRITEHIIDLSDLVLVFFDARHPEPGAMQDTLEHLVGKSIRRPDATKFLYILNQIDTTAREDNPEVVFGAWQRALAQKGLTAGRFYTLYAKDAAYPIGDEALRRRFESKRDADMAQIEQRIQQVEIERAYRIVGNLEKIARDLEHRVVPALGAALRIWKRRTLILDGILFPVIAVAALYLVYQLDIPVVSGLVEHPAIASILLLLILAVGGYLHATLRRLARQPAIRWLSAQAIDSNDATRLVAAFEQSTGIWRTLFQGSPAGWGRNARNRLHKVIADANRLVQNLNDRFASPSGFAGNNTAVQQPVAGVRAEQGAAPDTVASGQS